MFMSRKIFHQAVACIPVVFVQFLIGLGWGWPAPTLIKLQSNESVFKITAHQASWLASISEVGRMFGPFVCPALVDTVGRKNTLLLIAIIYVIVWSTVIFTRDIYILLATRVLFGVGNGINDVAAIVYTSENCSPNFRGIISGVVLLTFFTSLCLEFTITTYFSYTNAAIFNTLVSIGSIGSLYFAMETPYFLAMKDKHGKAKKNLTWLRAGVDENTVSKEMEHIAQNVADEKKKRQSIKSLFSSKENLKGIFALVGFYIVGTSVGFHAVIPYASMIFSSSETITSNEFAIIFGVAQLITAFISLFIVEKVNRKILLMTSYVLLAAVNVCTFFLLYFHNRNYDIAYYPWLLFLSVTSYACLGSLMAPAGYAIIGELLPLSVRAIGGSMVVTVQAFMSFCMAILFWPIAAKFGIEMNFLVYAIGSVLTVTFTYNVLPETRGKALHAMHTKSIETIHL